MNCVFKNFLKRYQTLYLIYHETIYIFQSSGILRAFIAHLLISHDVLNGALQSFWILIPKRDIPVWLFYPILFF